MYLSYINVPKQDATLIKKGWKNTIVPICYLLRSTVLFPNPVLWGDCCIVVVILNEMHPVVCLCTIYYVLTE
jgi:hypothetical protein